MKLASHHQGRAERSVHPTLAGLLSASPAKMDVVLPRFISVLEAIEDAHANLRQHRSLDPQKIHFTSEDKTEISSYAVQALEDTVVSGSPKYAAPDGFQSQPGTESCAARDSYSLGFIFYEIFLGTELFDSQFGEVEKRGSLGWFAWHANAANQPRPVSELVKGFPPMLSTLMEGMLAKDPAKRTTDLRKVAATLANALQVTQVYVGVPPEKKCACELEPSESAQAFLKPMLQDVRSFARNSVLFRSPAACLQRLLDSGRRLQPTVVNASRQSYQKLIAAAGRAQPEHLIALVLVEMVLLTGAFVLKAAQHRLPPALSSNALVRVFNKLKEDANTTLNHLRRMK